MTNLIHLELFPKEFIYFDDNTASQDLKIIT